MGQPSHAFDLAQDPGRAARRPAGARAASGSSTLDGAGARRSPPASASSAAAAGAARPRRHHGRRVQRGLGRDARRSRSRRRTGTRCASGARRRRSACTPRPRTASSGARIPRRTPLALARIAHLLEKIGAGTVRPGLIDVRAPSPAATRVRAASGARRPRCSARRCRPSDGAAHPDRPRLRGAGARATPARWTCRPGAATSSREVDLVEEVGRHHGLDPHPVDRAGGARRRGRCARASDRERGLRDVAGGHGPRRGRSRYSFVPAGSRRARAASRTRSAGSTGRPARRPRVPGPARRAAHATCGRAAGTSRCSRSAACSAADGAGLRETSRAWACSGAAPPTPPHWSRQAAAGRLLRRQGRRRALRARLRGRRRSSCAASARPDPAPGPVASTSTPTGWSWAGWACCIRTARRRWACGRRSWSPRSRSA